MQKRNLIVLVLLCLCRLLPAQEVPAALQPYASSIARHYGYSPVAGSALWSTKSGEAYAQRLLQDIEEARYSIALEYYWFSNETAGRVFRDALIQKAQEGVQVRVLMDNLICPTAPEAYYDKLRKAGAQVRYQHEFSSMCTGKAIASIFGYRDHRKIAVIDGRIAYTGGINLCDHAIYQWQDTQIRLEGPAAAQLSALFEAAWAQNGGSQSEDPSPAPAPAGKAITQVIGSNGDITMEEAFVWAIQRAERYFYIQTPYMAPTPGVLEAIKACAQRGIDVRILVPERCDWEFMNVLTKDYFPELLEAGVRIFVYSQGYDHTKLFVSDNSLACCGTVNLDYRSLVTNWEDAVLFYDSDSVLHFKSLFLDVAAQSTEVQQAQTAKGLKKAYRKLLRSLAPQF